MVERAEHPRNVERVIEAGGHGDAEAEAGGGTGNKGQHHQRIEQVELPAAPQNGIELALERVVHTGQVLKEASVKQPGL